MSDGDWPIIGNKFRGFPQALGAVLDLPTVTLVTPEPVEEELLLTVHTPALLDRERGAWYYEGALRTVGGCVAAAEGIAEGRLRIEGRSVRVMDARDLPREERV